MSIVMPCCRPKVSLSEIGTSFPSASPKVMPMTNNATVISTHVRVGGQLATLDAFDESDVRALNSLMSYRRLDRGQSLITEGDQTTCVYGVVSGGIKLLKSLRDGRTQMTAYLLCGELLGVPPCTYPYSVEGLSDTILWRLPIGPLEIVFQQNPKLRLWLANATYDQIGAAYDHMLLLGQKTMMERVCSFLIDLSERVERNSGPVEFLTIPLRRSEIGDYLGMTTETVSRGFSRLKRDGLISMRQADKITAIDRAALIEFANGGRPKRSPDRRCGQH